MSPKRDLIRGRAERSLHRNVVAAAIERIRPASDPNPASVLGETPMAALASISGGAEVSGRTTGSVAARSTSDAPIAKTVIPAARQCDGAQDLHALQRQVLATLGHRDLISTGARGEQPAPSPERIRTYA